MAPVCLNQAATPFSYCPRTVFLPVQPHCGNARPNILPLEELEETTRTPLYNMDEDYPAGPEIQ